MTSRVAIPLLVSLMACSAPADNTRGAGGLGPGPDPVVLRVARSGGFVRAYRYPRLDSLLWRSSQAAPPLASILAFDQENGALAYLDRKGVPGWVDLRNGTVAPATKLLLSEVTSSDAWAIYGVRNDSVVQRLTPSGDWSTAIQGKVTALYPLPDGSLVVIADRGSTTRALRLHPPEAAVTDSATLARPEQVAVSPLGDRLFFASDRDLIALGGQSFKRSSRIRMRDKVVALATSPSGDRVYFAGKGSHELEVIDRFTNQRIATVRLPAPVRELRVDPLGRLLLVRPVTGDSAWIVAIGTNRLVDAVATQWRTDLPSVAVDGQVATARGANVEFVVPGEKTPRVIVREGASELWYFTFWNGFRPRAKGLDQPVVFQEETLAAPAVGAVIRDSNPPPRVARVDTPSIRPAPAAPVDTPRRATPQAGGWTVSFAAVLLADRARELARQIKADGQQARVVVTVTEGVRIHRVVLGPYASRADAERAGRVSGHSFWVFEGPP